MTMAIDNILPAAGSTDVSRRALFGAGGVSLASLAMSNLATAANGATSPRSHFAPRARSVIFLFQVGGPSQLDLFDPKPELNRRDGQELPESLLKQVTFAQIQEKRPRLMGSPYRFRRHGESGAWVSELAPHMAGIVDRITIARTLRSSSRVLSTMPLLMRLSCSARWFSCSRLRERRSWFFIM